MGDGKQEAASTIHMYTSPRQSKIFHCNVTAVHAIHVRCAIWLIGCNFIIVMSHFFR